MILFIEIKISPYYPTLQNTKTFLLIIIYQIRTKWIKLFVYSLSDLFIKSISISVIQS